MVKKVRFIEPGPRSPYQASICNFYTYNKYIRNPSTGLITLTTLAKRVVADTLMYSEAISHIRFEDVYDADIIFISINTFNATRGYALAGQIRAHSRAVLVFGGLHASMNYPEAIRYCDYVLLGDGDESVPELIRTLGRGEEALFPGVVRWKDGKVVSNGARPQPEDIDTIPDRSLVYGYARLAKRYDTLWPQVHASRGCPHNCDYCAVVRHFGHKIRKRSPENVVEDIRQAIAFHRRRFPPRLSNCVWITDDNFAHDRAWAVSVLRAIIGSGIRYHFSVQARYETGFDDELLDLMRQAGFIELALGIEFLDDASFREFHKKSTYAEVVRAIENIQKHGLGVRGLFIVGAETDRVGVGDKIADFVIKNHIHGVLIQSMFFTPGTPAYEQGKGRLIHQDWQYYDGNVVHYPAHIKPHELQQEIINASAKIYSVPRLIHALLHAKGIFKGLFFGEFFWHRYIRQDLRRQLPYLRSLDGAPQPPPPVDPAP
ncbi:B12-binding domain-containing radical SAM protein [Intestinibacillus massiliensis]|nr:B12-binding domain-containing radical SAM protein [Intestinibacillus massiliensis]